ncbi:FAD-dependent oxidoreductase [Planctomycetota bacterium]
MYAPPRADSAKTEKVAVIGAGPAGLSAAHRLSLRGYNVTVFDANDKPGGMLLLGIPEFRLPREVITREIATLIDDNITLKLGVSLGKDLTVEQLFDDGFSAVFLALGSMQSMPLLVNGERANGVYPSLRFLGEFNLRGTSLAKARVGVIGGGNSAIDAARVALRQEGVKQVTIIYRRTREEMPAFSEEIDAAIDEGVVLKNLLSPVSVKTDNGIVSGLECIKNELGTRDDSGRPRPVPIAGSEHVLPLDTLIVAVGEKPEIEGVCFEQSDIKKTKWGSIAADPHTLTTSRKGVFAGGDVVTGPNTVVDAIAAGKRAAVMIDRYLAGEELRQLGESARPSRYVEPAPGTETAGSAERLTAPHAPAAERRSTFVEVEQVVTEESAQREARRCLRCDLDFPHQAGDTAKGRENLSSGGRR